MPLAPGETFAGYTVEELTPIQVCMEQTGQTRWQCRRDIRISNGLPPLP